MLAATGDEMSQYVLYVWTCNGLCTLYNCWVCTVHCILGRLMPLKQT